MDFYMDDKYLCIVVEKMSMSLMDYLNEQYDCLTRENKLAIFKEIAKAVQQCHQHGIMHRDIKQENVLVTVDDQMNVTSVKLGDFGFACNS